MDTPSPTGQIKREADRLERLIQHWCPPNCKELFPISLMRAFMGVTACAAEQAKLMEGKQVLRPIHSFSDPLFGWDFSLDKEAGFSTLSPRSYEELEKVYNPVQIIQAMLKALPNGEARLEAMDGICKYCGALDPRCQCSNDE